METAPRPWASRATSERAIVVIYTAMGVVLGLLFGRLSPAAEVRLDKDLAGGQRTLLGIGASRGVAFRLSGLFALDAFGGGFIVQSLAAYWFTCGLESIQGPWAAGSSVPARWMCRPGSRIPWLSCTGAALAPVVAGLLFARPSLIILPFLIAGTLKIAYDLALCRAFVRVQPPEEVR